MDLSTLEQTEEDGLAEAGRGRPGIVAGGAGDPAAGPGRSSRGSRAAARRSARPAEQARRGSTAPLGWQPDGLAGRRRAGTAGAGASRRRAAGVAAAGGPLAPACGMAGATPGYARAAMARCREAARLLPELIEEEDRERAEPLGAPGRLDAAQARGAERGDRRERLPVPHPGLAGRLRCRVRQAHARAPGAGGAVSGAAHAGLAHAAGRRGDRHRVHPGTSTCSACSVSTTRSRRRNSTPGRRGRPGSAAAGPTCASSRSTGWPSPWSTGTGRWSARRPGATAPPGRTSPRTSAPSPRCRSGSPARTCPQSLRSVARSSSRVAGVPRAERAAGRGGQGRRSPTRATPPPDRCGRRTRRSPRAARDDRARADGARRRPGRRDARAGQSAPPARGTQSGWYERLRGWGLPVSDLFRSCPAWTGCMPTSRTTASTGMTRRTRSTGSWSRSTSSTCSAQLGATSRAPRWAIAYKYPPEEVTTRLLDDPRSTWAAPGGSPRSGSWSR